MTIFWGVAVLNPGYIHVLQHSAFTWIQPFDIGPVRYTEQAPVWATLLNLALTLTVIYFSRTAMLFLSHCQTLPGANRPVLALDEHSQCRHVVLELDRTFVVIR
jgi:hypothetical protein